MIPSRMYGYDLVVNDTFFMPIIERRHKRKRINKKWNKRYGKKYKPQIIIVNETVYCNTVGLEHIKQITQKK